MPQQVGCGLRHVARVNHATANIQVGKQSERDDDQVENACDAGKQPWVFREAHVVIPGEAAGSIIHTPYVAKDMLLQPAFVAADAWPS